jgi:asparagine synthase (glutamine-hydrolysing)
MCGIAGYFSEEPSTIGSASLRDRLASMQAALRHRGPDDAGLWVNGGTGLAHTRLAILDLSSAGHQPMQTPDGRLTIVFNGEIYNFRNLRREMEQRGTAFATGTDTEVILRLYEQCGPGCVHRLHGMFAFAIWDGQERCGFLARDPFGIKPLYYGECGGHLVFASELRAMIASGAVSGRLDPSSVRGYFETGSVPEPRTLVQGVSMLPAGHTLTWSQGRSHIERYWQIEFPKPEGFDAGEAVQVARGALEDTIRAHLVSDVPVGIFLSGGIDSTAILALARAAGGQSGGLRTFSVAVDDAALDEGAAAEATARHFGTRHTSLQLDASAAARAFPQYLDAVDVPSIDGFNTWIVSALARRAGMKVVLSGLGGDELLGGYPSFSQVPWLARIARRMRWAGPLASGAGLLVERNTANSRWQRFGGFLAGTPSLSRAYGAYRGVFSPHAAQRLAAHFCGVQDGSVTPPEDDQEPLPDDPRNAISYLEMSRYMRNQLLRDSDVMSMAHGLELRVPLVDRDLFQSLRRVAPEIRFRPGKRLILEAVPEIPEAIARAPKRGFRFPFQKWLSAELGQDINQTACALPVPAREWYQRWSVFMFCRWRADVLDAARS